LTVRRSSATRNALLGAAATLLLAPSAAPAGVFGTAPINISRGGNGESGGPAISGDNRKTRYAAFQSDASNLIAGDTNGATDVFVRDRKTGETERVSLSSHCVQGSGSSGGSSISANGRFLAFGSSASNLVVGDTIDDEDVFVRGPLR
jgi:Tol biopolymer transport system component